LGRDVCGWIIWTGTIKKSGRESIDGNGNGGRMKKRRRKWLGFS
jgi:hypothetical protein